VDLTPKALTDAEFREAWRGYNRDDVDEFLERVAAGVGELQQRLAQATSRVSDAERKLLDRTEDDELRRTLVLAQRTADASIAEARAEAAKLVEETEERCRSLVADAESQAAALEAEIEDRRHRELGGLATQRDALQADIDALREHLAQERDRVVAGLREQLAWFESSFRAHDTPEVSDVEVAHAPAAEVEMRAATFVDAPDVEASDVDDEPEVDEELRSAREGLEDALRRAGLDDLVASDDERPPLFDDRAGEPTGAHEALDDDDDEEPEWRPEGPSEDDPFLAELRRAVGDTEPLGPRDHDDDVAAGIDLGSEDDAPGGFLRRRRRA
jgi:DivIVA domain-containing protein